MSNKDAGKFIRLLLDFMIKEEDTAMCKAIGENGLSLVKPGDGLLTHCNAGALATCGYGTALGVIRAAQECGKLKMVYSDETRPLLQGARLTAYELCEDNIPVTCITDGMAVGGGILIGNELGRGAR